MNLREELNSRIYGQKEAIETIVPFVQMHQAGLNPEGRPIGAILLLGPTGTGKTATVEALADALHGSKRNVLRIDCGEFQMDHEVAKLIGAPPGYLGHRETRAMLDQAKVNGMASDSSEISIVLFDEIEKAAPSLVRLLLGVLDKGLLTLGDNSRVNFERSLIFFTSNLGATAMQKALNPDFGFESMVPRPAGEPMSDPAKIKQIGMDAVKRAFSPEFVNRIDASIPYRSLTKADSERILEKALRDVDNLIRSRHGLYRMTLEWTPKAKALLLDKGFSLAYGARELKRVIQRELVQPLAALMADGKVPQRGIVILDAKGDQLVIKQKRSKAA